MNTIFGISELFYIWHSWSLSCFFQYTLRWIFAGNASVDIDNILLQSHGTCVRANVWGNMYGTCNEEEWRKWI